VGALPRPDLPPGPRRDLDQALHDLHAQAGRPSLRTLAAAAGCSHTTVSHVFSAARLPTWGVVELIAEAMDGDVAELRRLWVLAAGATPAAPAARPCIAGRGAELNVVRRHLESGSGLLLVTGEAGIGKTRLCASAAALASPEVTVLTGHCLPLSTEVPLLPVADVLRDVYDVDDGQWLKEAMADCPEFVLTSLRRLLPELESAAGEPDAPDGWSRQRLFAALGSVLRSLRAVRPFVPVLEDLHWADSSTLDLVEHLVCREGGPPIVATLRDDGASGHVGVAAWFARIRRLPGVRTLELAPLSREETAEQLRLLGTAEPSAAVVDRIYRRSRGQPLFTEQLAAHGGDGSTLPPMLSDLLDDRLEALDDSCWPVVRTLAVASRPLTFGQLRAASGVVTEALLTALRRLDDMRLLAGGDRHEVELRHPLLAQAVHRRLVPGESAIVHRMLAEVMAYSPSAAAADVAEHWLGAGDRAEELRWRIRAAQEADRRFAGHQAANHWQRVLDLWPPDAHIAGSPPLRRIDAYLATMDALEASAQMERAHTVAAEAMSLAPSLDDQDLGSLFRRSADYVADIDDEAALALVERSIHLLTHAGDSVPLLRALRLRAAVLGDLGRVEEALDAARSAAQLCARLGDPRLRPGCLMSVAWHEAVAGAVDEAKAHAAEATDTDTPVDPLREVGLGMRHTDILLMCGASADEVAEAGRRGIEAAERWGIENAESVTLYANVAEAMRYAGRVTAAAALVDRRTDDPLRTHRWALHLERAELDLLRGRHDQALERLDAISDLDLPSLWARAGIVRCAALIDLWRGRPRAALDRLLPLVEEAGRTDALPTLGDLLVVAARGAADLVQATAPAGVPACRRELLHTLRTLRDRSRADPRTPAFSVSWQAETARLAGTATVERWVAAAVEWDRHGRPHESAYCRWRAGQVAIATGRATQATPLLRRAAHDAREHQPLLEAIRLAVA
jgi:tetratricopeptide (TPR) repeat protein